MFKIFAFLCPETHYQHGIGLPILILISTAIDFNLVLVVCNEYQYNHNSNL